MKNMIKIMKVWKIKKIYKFQLETRITRTFSTRESVKCYSYLKGSNHLPGLKASIHYHFRQMIIKKMFINFLIKILIIFKEQNNVQIV